ncbi:MAG: TetR/AcrR family transcriptional regulator [Oscillospiraceae bacterium]|nr:TetR/AcrR family transcriptional regulator [Oscillospiraceae bacterium]
MNKSESKYFNTALRMNEALLAILEKKDFKYITIKEICEKAGVNRSTFYLHYQNTRELLDESIINIHRKFFDYFKETCQDFSISREIKNNAPENLVFINEKYLKPYFEFVSEHRRLYKTAFLKQSTFQTEESFRMLFKTIFNPVLAYFDYPKSERIYVIKFYISGIMAIVTEWIENDCRESIEQIINIMKKCIFANNN